MSLTNQPAKRTPRAMPVETIITRFKSAQQKKLQEPKQKKVKKDTIKKNKLESKKPILVPKPENKQTIEEFKQIVNNNEFYPNRQRRNIIPKKIVLVPKHCLKLIGGTNSCNKRKLNIPRKEIDQTRNTLLNDNYQISNVTELSLIKATKQSTAKTVNDISLPELVRIIEENGSLDDEDFLEILTCPSPVWWEDPPHGYIEEAIYTRKPVGQSDKTQNTDQTLVNMDSIDFSDNVVNNLVLNVEIENKGKNFIKKRGKLETLLNNIRDRINSGTDITIVKSKTAKREKKNSDSLDEDQLLDLRDDDILKDLENIDIPIENTDNFNTIKDIDYDSDKNMSIVEEYLDMSYFEDEDIKDTNSIDKAMDMKIESISVTPEKHFKRIAKESNLKTDKIDTNDLNKEINEPSTEYVAVYKIIESDDDERKNELDDLKTRYINAYYKHKKFKSNQGKSKCICNLKNKTIKVSDTESVKYCLICSSIYDTEDCKYCLGKLNRNCKCKTKYTCDVCNLKMSSKTDIIRHLKEHNVTLFT